MRHHCHVPFLEPVKVFNVAKLVKGSACPALLQVVSFSSDARQLLPAGEIAKIARIRVRYQQFWRLFANGFQPSYVPLGM